MGTENEQPQPSVEGIVVRRVELPSGGWAELRDPREVRTRDRKRALSGVQDGTNQIVMGLSMSEGLAIMLVEKWTVDYAPCSGAVKLGLTVEDIDDLIPGDTDALIHACAPAQRLLFPGQPTPDDVRPGSPTQPAGD